MVTIGLAAALTGCVDPSDRPVITDRTLPPEITTTTIPPIDIGCVAVDRANWTPIPAWINPEAVADILNVNVAQLEDGRYGKVACKGAITERQYLQGAAVRVEDMVLPCSVEGVDLDDNPNDNQHHNLFVACPDI